MVLYYWSYTILMVVLWHVKWHTALGHDMFLLQKGFSLTCTSLGALLFVGLPMDFSSDPCYKLQLCFLLSGLVEGKGSGIH